MAVTEQTPRNVSTAAPGATQFPYSFKIISKVDLLVQVNGVTKTVDVDYTVDGVGQDAGGTVTFLTPLAGGETVVRKRNMRYERATDYQNLGDLRSATLNNDQDAPILMIQQLAEENGRTVKIPAHVTGVSTELPAPVAGGLWGWDAEGDAPRYYTAAEIGTTLAFSNFIAERFTATAGQTTITLANDPGAIGNLDVSIDGATKVPVDDYTLAGKVITFTSALSDGQKVLVRYGTALPVGVTSAAAINYTPPSAGVAGTVKSFLDALDAGGAADVRADLARTNHGLGLLLDGTASGAAINQDGTGQHYTQNGARIHRLHDRVLVGGAADNDGAFPNVSKDWMSAYWAGPGNPVSVGPMVSAVFGVLNDTNPDSAIGSILGVQTKYFTSASATGIGVFGVVFNDNATLATKAYGGYFEAHRTTASPADTYGIEIDTRTLKDTVTPNPFQIGDVIGLQVASGAEWSATGQFDASAAIQIASNPVKFKKGIVFGATSITGTDGVTGFGEAISLAKGHQLRWYATGGVATATIDANATAAANAPRLRLADGAVYIQPANSGVGGVLSHAFVVTDNDVNYFAHYAAAAGGYVRLLAGGADANIDVSLEPKGSGLLRYGTWTSSADAPVNGYITIKDAGGTTRKLATIA